MGTSAGRKTAAAGAGLAAAGLLAALDSRYRLQVTEYTLAFSRLPAAFDGFRIVQLSDLHGAVFGPDNRTLARKAAALKPDLIALTGDLAGSRRELAATEGLLRSLDGTAPVYAVSGNHEWIGGLGPAMRRLLGQYGAHSLENRYEVLERGDGRIVIAGAEDPQAWMEPAEPERLAAQLRRDCPEDFVLWLGHRNFWVKEYPQLPVDLILSGHAHGGIMRLPGLGGVANNDHSFGAAYEAGVYSGDSYQMVVSRGLGNSVPVPRLFNRPEIVSIVLKKKQA